MRSERTLRLAYLTDNLSGMGEYQINVWHGILDAAKESGALLSCIIGGSLEKHPSNPFEGSRNFIYDLTDPDQFDGIIISGGSLGNHTSPENWANFCKTFSKVPLISISPAAPEVPYVIIDNDIGLANLLEHLIGEHGKKRIAFVTGALSNADAQQRLACYKRIISASPQGFVPELVYEGNWVHQGGAAAAEALMRVRPRPDAIVCSNDNMAIGAIAWLQSQNINVPNDVAVTGFDNTEEAATNFPKVSTVHQPVYELAKTAVAVLIKRITDKTPIPRETKVATKTVYRDSCGCDTRASMLKHSESTVKTNLDSVCLRLLNSESTRASLPVALIQELESWVKRFVANIGQDSQVLFKEFETLINRWRNEHTLAFVEMLLSDLQTGILSTIDYKQDIRNSIALLDAALTIVHELKVIMLQRNRRETELISSLLVETNRVLSGSFDLNDLQDNICKSFPSNGIQSCKIMLFDNNTNHQLAHLQAAMENGKPSPSNSHQSYNARDLFHQQIKESSAEALMILPLYYRNEYLGVVFLQQSTKMAFVYDALTLLLSTNIEGALLFSRIVAEEQKTTRQNSELKELIRPMLETLQKVAAETRSQTQLVSGVSTLNQDSTNRASQANQVFQDMRVDLEGIVRLLSMINDISETVSVVAINASISAAHAGQAGKAFTVIAHEIRKLAANTNQQAEEAGRLIQGMARKTGNYVETNQATIDSFSALSHRISSLATSLEQVDQHIETLANSSNNLLQKLNTTG